MKTYTVDELEEKARKFIDGEIEPYEIASLNVFDRLLVLQMANSFSLTKIGTMSPKACAAFKHKFLNENKELQYKAEYVMLEYDRICQMSIVSSGLLCENAKLLNSGNADVEQLLENAYRIIDVLTGDNVYLQMYHQAQQDKMFKAHAIQQGARDVDKYIEKWGSTVPYAMLLEKFYKFMCEGNKAEMWAQLVGDDYMQRARKVPVKDSNTAGIKKSLHTLYEQRL